MSRALPCELVRDPDVGGPASRVPPGGVGAVRDGRPFVSILGSCVAVCLFDLETGVGGMNHIVVGEGIGEDAKFGPVAMECLLEAMLEAGARLSMMQAKLTGGANVLPGVANIGASNAEFAERALLERNIPLVSKDVGGTTGRKVIFEPSTGRLRVKRRAEDKPAVRGDLVLEELIQRMISGVKNR